MLLSNFSVYFIFLLFFPLCCCMELWLVRTCFACNNVNHILFIKIVINSLLDANLHETRDNDNIILSRSNNITHSIGCSSRFSKFVMRFDPTESTLTPPGWALWPRQHTAGSKSGPNHALPRLFTLPNHPRLPFFLIPAASSAAAVRCSWSSRCSCSKACHGWTTMSSGEAWPAGHAYYVKYEHQSLPALSCKWLCRRVP